MKTNRNEVNQGDAVLPPLERSFLTLLRLAAKGDRASALQLARNVVAQPPDGVRDPAAFREAVGTVLVGIGAQGDYLRRAPAHPLPVDGESRMPLVRTATSEKVVLDPILNTADGLAVGEIIEERRRAEDLLRRRLEPTKTVLITGAPGVGKTMTARYIANALDLPLLTVDLAAIMSSFLGRTGQNLRAALEHAKAAPAVVLVDEFDALAKRRDDEADVGELKRIVNVLLLELEDWPQQSLLIAATNHPSLLDPAIGRRFDRRIDLGLPDEGTRHEIIQRALARVGCEVNTDVIELLAISLAGFPGSAVVQTTEQAVKTAVLTGRLPETVLLDSISSRIRDANDRTRAAFAVAARNRLGMSNRAIAERLGVTHPTVARLLTVARVDQSAGTS